jgi:hypothetical protein
MRIRRIDARGDERERVALEQITCVNENDAIRIRGANRVDYRCCASEASNGVARPGVIIPTSEPTVDVRGRRNDEVNRLTGPARSRSARAGRDRSDNGEARNDSTRAADRGTSVAAPCRT